MSQDTIQSASRDDNFTEGEILLTLDSEGVPIKTALWRDLPIIPFPNYHARLQESYREFRSCPGDVIIVAYPKSGTHWMHQIMWKLRMQDANFVPQPKEEAFMEMVTLEELHQLEPPRYMNTHLHAEQLAPEALLHSKLIFLYRNPKDVIVSFYHHAKGMHDFNYANGSWKGFFSVQAIPPNSTHNHMINWFDYHKRWVQHLRTTANQQQLWVAYENMLTNKAHYVKLLADFLGLPCSDQLCDAIVTATGIDRLRTEHLTYHANPEKMGTFSFYRKGIIGDWKNHFTVAQNEQFHQLYYEAEQMHKLELGIEKYMQ